MRDGLHTLMSGYGTWIEMSSTAALLITEQVRVLFDTGAGAQRLNLVSALAELNLRPEAINIVANTHLHMDHCENNALFTNARWYCSDAAYDDLIELVVALNAPRADLQNIAAQYLALPGGMPKTLFEKVEHFLVRDAIPEKLLCARRVGHRELNQLGIGVIDTPGHTDGHVSFVCHDAWKDTDIIIAGDAIISREHFKPGRRALFTHNNSLAERSKEELAKQRGWCLPGHGEAFFIPGTGMAPIESTINRYSLCNAERMLD